MKFYSAWYSFTFLWSFSARIHSNCMAQWVQCGLNPCQGSVSPEWPEWQPLHCFARLKLRPDVYIVQLYRHSEGFLSSVHVNLANKLLPLPQRAYIVGHSASKPRPLPAQAACDWWGIRSSIMFLSPLISSDCSFSGSSPKLVTTH